LTGPNRPIEDRVDLLCEGDVPRRQRAAEPERSRGEQHVLDGRVDRGALCPVRGDRRALRTVEHLVAPVEAGDDPDRRLVEVLCEVLDRGELAAGPVTV
jgi:hypothetical protein